MKSLNTRMAAFAFAVGSLLAGPSLAGEADDLDVEAFFLRTTLTTTPSKQPSQCSSASIGVQFCPGRQRLRSNLLTRF